MQTKVEAPEPRRKNRASRTLASLLGALRGDKYMANAYPPAWRSPADETHTEER